MNQNMNLNMEDLDMMIEIFMLLKVVCVCITVEVAVNCISKANMHFTITHKADAPPTYTLVPDATKVIVGSEKEEEPLSLDGMLQTINEILGGAEYDN